MARERMYTPVEPLPAFNTAEKPADHWIGVVMRLDAQFGRRPGTLGPEDEGAGFARDVYEIKKRLGRMPGTHGVDDEGEGALRHVFDQRVDVRRGRRVNTGALISAGVALLLAGASLIRAEARAMDRDRSDAARERPASTR